MDSAEIDRYLAELESDPEEVMARLPEKRDGAGRPRSAPTAFDSDDIDEGRFVTNRDKVRRKTRAVVRGAVVSLDEALRGKAPIGAQDRAEELVDTLRYRRPLEMEAAGLRKATLPVMPWPDDYWAIYQGVLGRRYADPNFPASNVWKENFDYVEENPASEIMSGGDSDAINLLSPSEKYDLLVGDEAWTLTKAMWREGAYYHEQSGKVELWMGICHGWAPASYMLPRPRRPVTVKAADGETDLLFYPSDIKALASLLWANANTAARFIGTRNEEKSPPKDENGRVLSASAFDNNPGTWHLSVVNQIGAAKRSLIIDATYDYEVWNQPLYGYEYSYFNPQTMRFSKTVEGAVVARSDFEKDRFARYRTSAFESVVGIAMRARYVAEVSPTQDEEPPDTEAQASVDYYYDLELDGRGAIVGGEWYLNKHPDFLWTPARAARAVTPAEQFATGGWSPSDAMPASWRAAAARASAQKLPLAKIVEQLIHLAGA